MRAAELEGLSERYSSELPTPVAAVREREREWREGWRDRVCSGVEKERERVRARHLTSSDR